MVAAISAAEYAHLAARGPRRAAVLIWLTAVNRRTRAPEAMGFWTGADHREFVVDGLTRPYFGAGGLIQLDPLRSVIGTDVQQTSATLHLPTPEIEMAVRGYDLRLAPVEIHRALFDPVSLAVIGITRRFVGEVDQIDISEPTVSADGTVSPGACKVTMVGSARAGTRPLSLKKSNASQRLRLLPSGQPDAFAQYADISGAVPLKWGVK